MLYDVALWVHPTNFGEPDIKCRVDALNVEDAARVALCLYNLPAAAYASVDAVNPVPGTIIAGAWGPVVREVC
jgi:hypothetical protein